MLRMLLLLIVRMRLLWLVDILLLLLGRAMRLERKGIRRLGMLLSLSWLLGDKGTVGLGMGVMLYALGWCLGRTLERRRLLRVRMTWERLARIYVWVRGALRAWGSLLLLTWCLPVDRLLRWLIGPVVAAHRGLWDRLPDCQLVCTTK
jgi:hypothetical protein